MWGIEASFALPLLPSLAASADDGVPFVLTRPADAASEIYRQLAAAVEREVEALPGVVLPQLFYLKAEKTILVGRPGSTEPQRIRPAELRALCRSPTNRPDHLPDDLEPLDFVPCGNYAVSVRWSDGHQSMLPYASFVEKASTSFPVVTFSSDLGSIG